MTSKSAKLLVIAGGIAIGLAGCQSAGSSGKRTVVVGPATIMVKAEQPKLPPPPPPPRVEKPRPRPKAKLVAKKIEITEKVMFDYGKATIKPESHSLLKDVADVLKKNPQVKKIRIEGHTDSDGSSSMNQRLSQQRADAVRQFLIDQGIAASRLVSKGYGESKPIADNKTDEGKEKNRRVEFNVIEQ